MGPPEKSEPTDRKTKFVGLEEQRSLVLRNLLAGLWLFVRRNRLMPAMGGDISMWICEMHGFQHSANTVGDAQEPQPSLEIGKVLRFFGPSLDPETIRESLARGAAIQSGAPFRAALEAASRNDFHEFNVRLQGVLKTALASWLPNFEPPFDLSLPGVLRVRRAVRATVVGMALFRAHPLALIGAAWKGEQSAVLELVRMDKLFLQDRCTSAVIGDAALRNDRSFLDQLAIAQRYQPRLQRRDLIHIYFHVLFLLEKLGEPLPRIDQLQRLLDPQGTIFGGVYAFERDLQRRRERFNDMLSQVDAEFTTILNFYRAAPSKS